MDLTFSEIFSTLTKTWPTEGGLITIELTRIIQSLYYAFFFREQMTRFYDKESASPRAEIADRWRLIIRVTIECNI